MSLNEIMQSRLINPSSEQPVSSAQIPKVLPKLAILSVVVVVTCVGQQYLEKFEMAIYI